MRYFNPLSCARDKTASKARSPTHVMSSQFFKTCAALFLLSTTAMADDEINWTQGAWGHLSQYIGTYNYAAVLGDPAVAQALSARLGNDLPRLSSQLQTAAPIGFVDDCLVLSGNADHKAFQNSAYVHVCIYNGHVDVVLTDGPKIKVYSEYSIYMHLSRALRAWIGQYQASDHFVTLPNGVSLQ